MHPPSPAPSWRFRLSQWIVQHGWQRRGLWCGLMWPLSALYRGLESLRRLAYCTGLFKSWRAPLPVMVVGNVLAGGTGKTPLLIALAQALRQRGLRVGVVSRGYGRHSRAALAVQADSDPHKVGDEALLIHRHTGAPTYVAATRREAIEALLNDHPDTALILSDDGLQHWALARDVELCVFDARGVGNGALLPAGPLREPWPRRATPLPVGLATPAFATASTQGTAPVLASHTSPSAIGAAPHFTFSRELAPWAVRADRQTLAWQQLSQTSAKLAALAGIAQPEAFFAELRRAGLRLTQTIALPDHYDFSSKLLNIDGGMVLICTEKDAVKLWRTHPQAWAIPLSVQLPDALVDWVMGALGEMGTAPTPAGAGVEPVRPAPGDNGT